MNKRVPSDWTGVCAAGGGAAGPEAASGSGPTPAPPRLVNYRLIKQRREASLITPPSGC